jgi:hypothetical protein
MKDTVLENINIHRLLSFKFTQYHRNFDFFDIGDSYVNYIDGSISFVSTDGKSYPKQIGEYNIIKFSLNVAREVNVNIKNIIQNNDDEIYDDLKKIIKTKNHINLENYDNLYFINNFILAENYRKKDISFEFFEKIYRMFYNERTLILMLVKPFQYIEDDYEYFLNEKTITIKPDGKNTKNIKIPAGEYYSLKNLPFDDVEYSTFKLYAQAKNIGLNRIGNTGIFKFQPDVIKNRMKYKYFELDLNNTNYVDNF